MTFFFSFDIIYSPAGFEVSAEPFWRSFHLLMCLDGDGNERRSDNRERDVTSASEVMKNNKRTALRRQQCASNTVYGTEKAMEVQPQIKKKPLKEFSHQKTLKKKTMKISSPLLLSAGCGWNPLFSVWKPHTVHTWCNLSETQGAPSNSPAKNIYAASPCETERLFSFFLESAGESSERTFMLRISPFEVPGSVWARRA